MSHPSGEATATRSRWAEHTELPLSLAAVVFLLAYAWPVFDPGLSPSAQRLAEGATALVWSFFAIDYMVRLSLAEQRSRFVCRTCWSSSCRSCARHRSWSRCSSCTSGWSTSSAGGRRCSSAAPRSSCAAAPRWRCWTLSATRRCEHHLLRRSTVVGSGDHHDRRVRRQISGHRHRTKDRGRAYAVRHSAAGHGHRIAGGLVPGAGGPRRAPGSGGHQA